MANAFLPDDFEMPKGDSKYMKLVDGENRFRILSKALIGWEYWVEKDGKPTPVRVKTKNEVPDEYINTSDWKKRAKYFWAFAVFNQELADVQILELTQKGVMAGIHELVKNKKWGDPTQYDIVVMKKKTGQEAKDVEFTVMPEPKEELQDGVLKFYQDMNVDLNALYRGEDPFKSNLTEDVDFDTLIDEQEAALRKQEDSQKEVSKQSEASLTEQSGDVPF